jgi:hypothetical protein
MTELTELVRLGRRKHPRLDDDSFVEDFEVYISGKGFKVHVYMTKAENYTYTINKDIEANWNAFDDEAVKTLTHIRDNVLAPGKFVCAVSFTDFAGRTSIGPKDRSSPSEEGAYLFDVLRLVVAAYHEILIADGEIDNTCMAMMMSEKADPRRSRVYQKTKHRLTADVFKNTFCDTNADSILEKIYVY